MHREFAIVAAKTRATHTSYLILKKRRVGVTLQYNVFLLLLVNLFSFLSHNQCVRPSAEIAPRIADIHKDFFQRKDSVAMTHFFHHAKSQSNQGL